MAIYTGVADANGDFTVPFSSNYTGGQKVTVTAEKDSATKSIELYAPSEFVGGGVIEFSGNLTNFPNNVGDITINDVTTFGDYAFYRSNNDDLWSKATGLNLASNPTIIGQYAFYNWSGMQSINLGNALTTIGQFAFYKATGLKSLEIPDSVTSIGASCFNSCTSLESLIIGTGLTSLGGAVFFNCGNLVEIVIPNNILSISSQTFQVTSGANTKKIIIGENCASISSQAFAGQTACDEIICHRTIPPTIQASTFQNLNAACIIKVPAASVSAYQAAAHWSAFAARIQAI